MLWIILFIGNWILFALLVDLKSLKLNIWGGVFTLFFASLIDWGAINMGFYKFYDIIVPWFECSAFYKFGPILTVGILFAQFTPSRKWLQVFNILIVTGCYLSTEAIVILSGYAAYLRWNIAASLIIDILTLTSLTWFTMYFIRNAGYPANPKK